MKKKKQESAESVLRGEEFSKCKCGHEKRHHIYHEGACRPGFECKCAKFESKKAKDEEFDRETQASGV